MFIIVNYNNNKNRSTGENVLFVILLFISI